MTAPLMQVKSASMNTAQSANGLVATLQAKALRQFVPP